MTITALPAFTVAFFLVFARVGAMVMLLPGLGERSTPGRLRLTLALLITLIMLPSVRPLIKVDVNALESVLPVFAMELVIGLMLGLVARFTLAALQVAGVVIAQQLGLAFAMMVDPNQGGQSVVIGNFLSILGITLIFVTDLHHLGIAAIHDSYRVLDPGSLPPSGDAAELIIKSMAAAFALGIQISAPFLVFSIVFNLGLGVLSRLMPQLQVFFLAMPAAIILGIFVLIALLALMMGLFLSSTESALSSLLAQ